MPLPGTLPGTPVKPGYNTRKAIYKGMQELKEDEELHWFCLKCLEDIRGAFRDKVIGGLRGLNFWKRK